jgi:hypothetical protein
MLRITVTESINAQRYGLGYVLISTLTLDYEAVMLQL